MTQGATTSSEPSFTMPWQESQSRLTTFFRWLTVIPPAIWWCLWSIVLVVTVPISWFALLFTGRYPASLYDMHGAYARYQARFYAYMYLGTDRFPGFSAPDDDYP